MTWDWKRFKGSEAALKWNRRDLPALDQIVARCTRRRVAVQAGGHLGLFPKRLAESFGVVYTFEPAPRLFAAMSVNAPEGNIIRFQAALGEHRGLVGLSQSRRDGTTNPEHEGLTHVEGAGHVPTLLIDDLALPICDLLCLDLEGFELFALRGAVETITRCRPVIGVEVNANIAHYGMAKADVHQFLTALDYRHVDRQASDDVFLPLERAA